MQLCGPQFESGPPGVYTPMVRPLPEPRQCPHGQEVIIASEWHEGLRFGVTQGLAISCGTPPPNVLHDVLDLTAHAALNLNMPSMLIPTHAGMHRHACRAPSMQQLGIASHQGTLNFTVTGGIASRSRGCRERLFWRWPSQTRKRLGCPLGADVPDLALPAVPGAGALGAAPDSAASAAAPAAVMRRTLASETVEQCTSPSSRPITSCSASACAGGQGA